MNTLDNDSVNENEMDATSINKADLITSVVEATNVTKVVATQMVNGIIKYIIDSIKLGKSVKIVGLGTFKVKDKPETTGRNPKTREIIKIPFMKVVRFVPSKILKTQLAQLGEPDTSLAS